MEIRGTQQQSLDKAVRQAQLRQRQIGKLQDQLATGLKINRPSDAPSEWGSLQIQKSSINRMDTELANIATVRQRLNQSVSTLTEAGNLLVRARELALGGVQSQEPQVLASEVDRLIDAMLSIANAAESGLQLYSGTASASQPFEVTAKNEEGRPTKIEYVGGADTSPVVVGHNAKAMMLSNGADVFQQTRRGKSVFTGKTGIAAGKGTDNASGVSTLKIRNTGTTYLTGGVTSGASAAGGDTVLGPAGANKLEFSTHATLGRVVQLNGGAPTPFDASSTDLRVNGPDGATVYLDMSAVPPTFAGLVDIATTGAVSADDGATEIAIDYSESQLVTNSKTGKITVVDTTNVTRVGTSRVEHTGSTGVFDAMIQLRDDLNNADQWSSSEFQQIMDARLNDIVRAHDQVIEFVGEQSVELANLETLESRTREMQLVTKQNVIQTENADIADVIVRLQTEQQHLEFIYAATSNIMSTNLLDFIR